MRTTLDPELIAKERARRGPPKIGVDKWGREMYEPDGQVLARFVLSDNKVDIIQGPLGSGKTVGMFRRIGRHAMQQRPSTRDRLRKTRWFIARNTFPELKRTTIKTWKDVWPEEKYGAVKMSPPMSHTLRFGDVSMDVDFLSLDDEDDIKKLRSADYTGGAFHEVQYLPLELFREARSRVNRFPPEGEGGATWAGVMADANAPDEDHWLALMTGQVDIPADLPPDERRALQWPDEWGFFNQPPAAVKLTDSSGEFIRHEINLDAENLRWLANTYYLDQLAGNKTSWIDNRLGNKVVLVATGSPVWPMFRRDYHVARRYLEPVQGHDLIIALDFGRVYPGALFAQEIDGRLFVQYEMLGFNEPATVFAPKVKRFADTHYGGCKFTLTGDPKGQDKGQATDHSSYQVYANVFQTRVRPAPVKKNDIETRTEAVAFALNDNPAGVPFLNISPACRTLVVGMEGRYCLTREEDGQLRPKKDRYSHLCDCLQYLCLDLGVSRKMIGLKPAGQVRPAQVYKGRQTMRRVSG